jgi:cholesterol oxidase
MANSLSTPIGELQAEYGVVVVGSGYGGAIAAHRMAEAAQATGADGKPYSKYSVCVLERGTERQQGDFPSTLYGAVKDLQADAKIGRIGRRTALFDFRMNRDISVLVGCGLGGTSLINAAVMLKPTDEVLRDPRWPAELRDPAILCPYFVRARKALDVHRSPSDLNLAKVKWLGADVKPPERVRRAPVAISFQTKVNQFNVQQQRCVLCGSCITGCNHSAKNTVATNYLAGAMAAGAAIFCGVETRAVEKASDGSWLVHVRLNDKTLESFGNPEIVIRASMVFLAAGTLGSTEILLRSQHRHGLALSPMIGRHFSGNGDVIAFGYNAPELVNGFGYGDVVPRNASVGPTIAGVLDERKPGKSGAMIQEGAIPSALRFPLRFAAPVMARVTNLLADASVDLSFRHIWREIDTIIRGVHYGALVRTQTFLAMHRDDGKGTMGMRDDRLRISWEHLGYQEMYQKISCRLQRITSAMKGRYVINPFWSRFFGRRLMTVHPMGGCCLADSPENGVVNAKGEVFDGLDPAGRTHSGLFVCDGSIIPMPLGTNPSLTISALAERIVETAASHPGLLTARPIRRRPGRIMRSIPGIQYAERLRGPLTLDGKQTRAQLTLHLSASSVDEVITEEQHRVRVIGIAETPDLDSDFRRWTVSGTLNILIDDPRTVDTKLLVYRLTLTGPNGRTVWLRGHKTVNLETLRRRPWLALTRVPFVILDTEPHDRRRDVELDIYGKVETWDRTGEIQPRTIGCGAVRSTFADTLRLPLSVRIVREPNLFKRLRWHWRFTRLFLKTVIQLRVWAVRTTRAINPFDAEELKKFSVKDILDEPIPDDPISPKFLVTRYKGLSPRYADRGPVLLAPGFGMSTLAFYAARDASFAEYLRKQGYDVWLFDYRVSDKLDASLEQFDVDVLAQQDFPKAIKQVHDETKQKVRIVAHCLSSMTMQMGLLAGKIDQADVKSMLLSQSFAFIDLPWPTRLKVRLHLPELLRYFNFRPTVTSDFDRQASFGTKLLDRLLYFFPSNERCYEGVCRRLLLMYGEVVRHDHLDKNTHETFYHLFDRGNLTAFKHIGRMFILGHIANKNGENTYLVPAKASEVRIPITFLQGTANNMFLPSGALKTHQWFLDHGPGTPEKKEEQFRLVMTPGYGHLDNFIGRDAGRDVFPKIVAELERMEALN